jgi:molybdopterin molybdotransferase
MYNGGMLTLAEARSRLLALAGEPRTQVVSVNEALGRVVLEDVTAPEDAPPFDASMMDGYAVHAADLVDGKQLVVSGTSKTGEPLGRALTPKTACRIFTGAVIPEGADTVVMQEDVTRKDDLAIFSTSPRVGQHIRRRGEDLSRGQVALSKGTRLRPAHLSLAATLDRRELAVARTPRVIVLATGDELRDPGTPGAPGTIPESNGIAIASMVARCGGVCEIAPRMRDSVDDVRAAIERALQDADVLVTVGGVSVGDHDVVRPALEAAGVTLDFWRVAIKPGKPICVGSKGGRIVLGLPGNPASAMVTFALFGIPLLRTMQGDRRPWPIPLKLPLAHDHTRKPGRLEFARACIVGDAVELVRHQASGSVLGMADANALVALEADLAELGRGTRVDVYPFSEIGL